MRMELLLGPMGKLCKQVVVTVSSAVSTESQCAAHWEREQYGKCHVRQFSQ